MAQAEDDVDEMQRWLAQGLGRAVLHLETHESAPYRDLILRTCLYDDGFDSQVEPDRAPYLYDVLLASGDEDYFRTRILADFVDPNTEDLNMSQLAGLLVEWARRGDVEARRVLYAVVGEDARNGVAFAEDRLIDLDGWDGFVFLAEQFGAAIESGADNLRDDALMWIESALGEDAVALRLAKLRDGNRLIAAYLDAKESSAASAAARRAARKSLSELDYWQLKDLMGGGKLRSWLGLRGWARHNPNAPWPAIAADVLADPDQGRQATCLRLFSQVEFPLGHAPLLPLLWSDHERLVWAAAEALEWFEHPAIRAEALAMLAADQYPDTALRLLVANWQPGDYAIVEARLRSHESIEELHDLGLAAQSILDEHLAPEAAEVLLYLYENGPCAFCRHRVVEHLLELELLPDWMRYECGFDSNPDIRALVRTHV
jgi:hypothetical protein